VKALREEGRLWGEEMMSGGGGGNSGEGNRGGLRFYCMA